MKAPISTIRAALAPTGVLRAGINMSNFLLVSSRHPHSGAPAGVAPDMAAELALQLDVPLQVAAEGFEPGALPDLE